MLHARRPRPCRRCPSPPAATCGSGPRLRTSRCERGWALQQSGAAPGAAYLRFGALCSSVPTPCDCAPCIPLCLLHDWTTTLCLTSPLPPTPPTPLPARYNKLEVLAVAHRKFGCAAGLASAKAAAGGRAAESSEARQARKIQQEARRSGFVPRARHAEQLRLASACLPGRARRCGRCRRWVRPVAALAEGLQAST